MNTNTKQEVMKKCLDKHEWCWTKCFTEATDILMQIVCWCFLLIMEFVCQPTNKFQSKTHSISTSITKPEIFCKKESFDKPNCSYAHKLAWCTSKMMLWQLNPHLTKPSTKLTNFSYEQFLKKKTLRPPTNTFANITLSFYTTYKPNQKEFLKK